MNDVQFIGEAWERNAERRKYVSGKGGRRPRKPLCAAEKPLRINPRILSSMIRELTCWRFLNSGDDGPRPSDHMAHNVHRLPSLELRHTPRYGTFPFIHS
jgi:hypothetical protein